MTTTNTNSDFAIDQAVCDETERVGMTLTVNGHPQSVAIDPLTSLLDLLRETSARAAGCR
jgi:hypothetical protein